MTTVKVCQYRQWNTKRGASTPVSCKRSTAGYSDHCISCPEPITLVLIVCSTFSVSKSNAAGKSLATETGVSSWGSPSNACRED